MKKFIISASLLLILNLFPNNMSIDMIDNDHWKFFDGKSEFSLTFYSNREFLKVEGPDTCYWIYQDEIGLQQMNCFYQHMATLVEY